MHNILLVEDTVETYHLVKIAVGQSAHLEWAKSLAEAYALVDKKDFDLVLLDLTLPDGDGYRLCSLMQSTDRLKKVPVVFISGRNSVADKVMGFSVGGDDYVQQNLLSRSNSKHGSMHACARKFANKVSKTICT